MTTEDDCECDRPHGDCICTVLCGECNGSGEGRFDGTNCRTCKGGGEVRLNAPERDPDRDREDWLERRAEEAREERIFADE